jgi:hypothetical protein
MNSILERVRRIGQEAWVLFLARLNALMLTACAGLVMLNQTNPEMVNSLVKTLTPTQQALAGLAFCTLVQYALRRVKKAGE